MRVDDTKANGKKPSTVTEFPVKKNSVKSSEPVIKKTSVSSVKEEDKPKKVSVTDAKEQKKVSVTENNNLKKVSVTENNNLKRVSVTDVKEQKKVSVTENNKKVSVTDSKNEKKFSVNENNNLKKFSITENNNLKKFSVTESKEQKKTSVSENQQSPKKVSVSEKGTPKKVSVTESKKISISKKSFSNEPEKVDQVHAKSELEALDPEVTSKEDGKDDEKSEVTSHFSNASFEQLNDEERELISKLIREQSEDEESVTSHVEEKLVTSYEYIENRTLFDEEKPVTPQDTAADDQPVTSEDQFETDSLMSEDIDDQPPSTFHLSDVETSSKSTVSLVVNATTTTASHINLEQVKNDSCYVTETSLNVSGVEIEEVEDELEGGQEPEIEAKPDLDAKLDVDSEPEVFEQEDESSRFSSIEILNERGRSISVSSSDASDSADGDASEADDSNNAGDSKEAPGLSFEVPTLTLTIEEQPESRPIVIAEPETESDSEPEAKSAEEKCEEKFENSEAEEEEEIRNKRFGDSFRPKMNNVSQQVLSYIYSSLLFHFNCSIKFNLFFSSSLIYILSNLF